MKKILFIVLFLFICSPLAFADPCSDSVGCFLMEDSGNETDESKGNTLTETGGTIPQDADAKFGSYSRDFEVGDTEYLTHADGLDTDISGADQSISFLAWYKPESGDVFNESVVGKMDTGGSQEQYLMFRADASGDVMRCYLSSDGSTLVSAQGATATTAGSWYHIACVYNDTDIRLYIDGVLDSNGASNPKSHTSGIYDGTSPFAIGVNYSSGSPDGNNYADGLVDDVGIFDTGKSSTQVNDIMDNGLVQAAEESTFTPKVMMF